MQTQDPNEIIRPELCLITEKSQPMIIKLLITLLSLTFGKM